MEDPLRWDYSKVTGYLNIIKVLNRQHSFSVYSNALKYMLFSLFGIGWFWWHNKVFL